MFSIWLEEKINQEFQQKIYHANVNPNLMVEIVIQL